MSRFLCMLLVHVLCPFSWPWVLWCVLAPMRTWRGDAGVDCDLCMRAPSLPPLTRRRYGRQGSFVLQLTPGSGGWFGFYNTWFMNVVIVYGVRAGTWSHLCALLNSLCCLCCAVCVVWVRDEAD